MFMQFTAFEACAIVKAVKCQLSTAPAQVRLLLSTVD
jgi:hypothetical protein